MSFTVDQANGNITIPILTKSLWLYNAQRDFRCLISMQDKNPFLGGISNAKGHDISQCGFINSIPFYIIPLLLSVGIKFWCKIGNLGLKHCHPESSTFLNIIWHLINLGKFRSVFDVEYSRFKEAIASGRVRCARLNTKIDSAGQPNSIFLISFGCRKVVSCTPP